MFSFLLLLLLHFRCFYIGKAQSGAAELKRRAIGDDNFPLLIAAITEEWNAAVGSKAAAAIVLEEAPCAREGNGERVLASRVLLRWKPTEHGATAKARWVARGFEDPDVAEIERGCPTPQLDAARFARPSCAACHG